VPVTLPFWPLGERIAFIRARHSVILAIKGTNNLFKQKNRPPHAKGGRFFSYINGYVSEMFNFSFLDDSSWKKARFVSLPEINELILRWRSMKG
jgi:hypothetical protein